MELTLAKNWNELSAWQKREFSYILLSEEALKNPILLLKTFIMRNNSLWQKWRFFRIIRQVPISELFPYLDNLLKINNLHKFPRISRKLTTPGERMNNCTIKQFSFCDAIFYKLTGNRQKVMGNREMLEKQLVASLYIFKGEHFDPLQLPKIAEITDKIDEKTRSQIVFSFMCIRQYIEKRYPKIFSSPQPLSEKEGLTPHLRKSRNYVPFTKVIHSMAMDERQPLGNLHQCNDTLIYDFFDILQEAMDRQ